MDACCPIVKNFRPAEGPPRFEVPLNIPTGPSPTKQKYEVNLAQGDNTFGIQAIIWQTYNSYHCHKITFVIRSSGNQLGSSCLTRVTCPDSCIRTSSFRLRQTSPQPQSTASGRTSNQLTDTTSIGKHGRDMRGDFSPSNYWRCSGCNIFLW